MKTSDDNAQVEEFDHLASLRKFVGDDDPVESVIEDLQSRYVVSSRDREIESHLRLLGRNSLKPRFGKLPYGDNNRRAGIGFVISGESGSGKTRAMERALVNNPAFPGYGVPGARCIFVSVLAPSPCTLAQLGNATLEALGYATEKPLRENEAWKRVRGLLKKRRVLFLHYDDVHNILQRAINAKEKKKIQATFRNLLISAEWPVQLVLSGITETLDLFKDDRQLKRRMRYIPFDSLTDRDVEQMRGIVENFAEIAKLKFTERPGSMLIERLCHASAYQFGLAIELLIDAIKDALEREGKRLGIEHFIASYASRTAQPSELNVFASPAWQTIDPSIIYADENKNDDTSPKQRRKVA